MRLRILLPVVGLLGLLLPTSCASPLDDAISGGSCVPAVAVQPRVVAAGDTITVNIDEGCDSETPAGGWVIVAAPLGGPDAAVRTTVDDDLVNGLDVELHLPSDFQPGEAFAGLDDWDYSDCDDTSSCASPTGDFTVIRSTTPDWSADVIETSRASSDASVELSIPTDRDCGEVLLGLGESVSDESMRCMDDAIGVATAELVIARPTMEGDPIVYFYRTGPDIDGIRYFIDNSLDSYGIHEWAEKACPGISTIRDPTGCTLILD